MPDTAFTDLSVLEPLSDDELTRLALEADPDTPVAAGSALSLWELVGAPSNGLLPAWYMPAPGTVHTGRGWRRVAAVCRDHVVRRDQRNRAVQHVRLGRARLTARRSGDEEP